MAPFRGGSMTSFHMLPYLIGISNLLLTKAYKQITTKIGSELRIGIMGVVPNIYIDEDDVIRGSDITALRSLSEKMGFKYNISLVRSFDAVVNQVCLGSEHLVK